MSDLPSRNIARLIANMRGLPIQAFGIVDAFASGRLVDRETINYKAALAKLMAWDAYRDGRRAWPFGDDLVRVGEVPAIHAIVAAAIGDGE